MLMAKNLSLEWQIFERSELMYVRCSSRGHEKSLVLYELYTSLQTVGKCWRRGKESPMVFLKVLFCADL